MGNITLTWLANQNQFVICVVLNECRVKHLYLHKIEQIDGFVLLTLKIVMLCNSKPFFTHKVFRNALNVKVSPVGFEPTLET